MPFCGGGGCSACLLPISDRIDAEAMVNGYRNAPNLIRHSRLEILTERPQKLVAKLPQLLEWLIATRRLDVRIAGFNAAGMPDRIYHEKIGLFEDTAGNIVAFCGSANESGSGLNRNFEVVDVYKSWDRVEGRRARTKQEDFDRLWRSETPALTGGRFSAMPQEKACS